MSNPVNRRDFLRLGAAAGAIALARPSSLLAQDKKHNPIGHQLYSVRDVLGKDFEGTLKQVAELGFEGVEFAGYGKYGKDPEGLRKLLDELKLKAAGTHIGAGSFAGDALKKTIDFHKTIGCKFLIVPGDGRYTKSDASNKEYAEFMTKAAEALKPEGLFTGHHNHTGEFAIEKESGKSYFDLFAERTSKDVVIQQDMGHTMAANVDPIAIVKKYSGRVRTTHIKNRPAKASGKKPFVGEDNFDWKAYCTACYENGTEWFTLEQEEYPDGKSSMECTKISLEGLKAVLKDLGH
jgi:sugar phosphate isomerase/epimerase